MSIPSMPFTHSQAKELHALGLLMIEWEASKDHLEKSTSYYTMLEWKDMQGLEHGSENEEATTEESQTISALQNIL